MKDIFVSHFICFHVPSPPSILAQFMLSWNIDIQTETLTDQVERVLLPSCWHAMTNMTYEGNSLIQNCILVWMMSPLFLHLTISPDFYFRSQHEGTTKERCFLSLNHCNSIDLHRSLLKAQKVTRCQWALCYDWRLIILSQSGSVGSCYIFMSFIAVYFTSVGPSFEFQLA